MKVEMIPVEFAVSQVDENTPENVLMAAEESEKWSWNPAIDPPMSLTTLPIHPPYRANMSEGIERYIGRHVEPKEVFNIRDLTIGERLDMLQLKKEEYIERWQRRQRRRKCG